MGQRRPSELDGEALPLADLIEVALGYGEFGGLLLGQLSRLDLRVDDGQIGLPIVVVVEEVSVSSRPPHPRRRRRYRGHQGVEVGHIA
jgi:hypothetical protein